MGIETRIFRNTQNGALAMAGEASSLKNLLHSVLFGSGYGSITPDSITRSGTTATLTRAAGHGFIDQQVIQIAGADQAAYNGSYRVTVTSSTVLTFAVAGSPATPATGTITAKTPAVGGWAERWTGTGKTVLYSTDLAASGKADFRIDDTGTTTARIVGYESTSDVDTGTNPYPTTAQLSGGGYILKSSTANTTARDWLIVANPRTVYLLTVYNGTNFVVHGFGDLSSPYPGDQYHGFVMACNGSSHTSPPYVHYMYGATFDKIWVARNQAATVGAAACAKRGPNHFSGVTGSGGATYAYPSPLTTSGVLFGTGSVKVEIQSGEFRGFMPGMVPILNAVTGAVANGTTFVGVSGFADPLILLRDNYPSNGSIALSLGDW